MIDVLVVSTAVGTLDRVTSLLRSQRLTVKSVEAAETNGVDALVSRVEREQPKLVIVDLDRFEEPALDFLRQILGGEKELAVLLLVALGQENLVVRASLLRGRHQMDFRIKPFDSDIFVGLVKGLLWGVVTS